jgi:hypothetical protein
VDDIMHQVVLNHLYQHQCSSLWIRDYNDNIEGAMVRRKKNDYLFKPQALETSAFARAMTALNVQVRTTFFSASISQPRNGFPTTSKQATNIMKPQRQQ